MIGVLHSFLYTNRYERLILGLKPSVLIQFEAENDVKMFLKLHVIVFQ